MFLLNFFGNSLVFRSLVFGYSNSRVKAMKQFLLDGKDLRSLASFKSVNEIYSFLEKSHYKDDLVAVGIVKGRSVADSIEFALTKNFSKTLSKVNKVSPSLVRDKVACFFERYDANNVKVVLLGKHFGHEPEKIRQLIIEGGVISRGVIEKAISAKTLKDAVFEFAGSDYGSAAAVGFSEFEKSKKILSLIEAIDNAYYLKTMNFSKVANFDSRLLKILRAQIDFKNVSNVLRAKHESFPESKILSLVVAKGNIPFDVFRQAAQAKNVEDAAKFFSKYFDFSSALMEYSKSKSIIGFELAMDRAFSQSSLSLFRSSVLSVEAIIGFVLLKELEVSNIRKIVRAKEFGLSEEKLSMMVAF